MTDLAREDWRRVLERTASVPTASEVARTLADADVYPHDDADAYAAVDDALADDVLVERDGTGAFPELALASDRIADPTDDVPPLPDVVREHHPAAARRDDVTGAVDPELAASGQEPTADAGFLHLNPGGNVDESARAFAAAVAFYHDRLDRPADLPGDGVDTPRDYYREGRGWDDATINGKRLGFAPASPDALLNHLMAEGFDREAILGTGLFWDGLEPIWRGRFVLPYFDADGRPTFAISRRVGDDGHDADRAGQYGPDDVPAKYHKIPDREATAVAEPIYGLPSLEPGEPVLITEGIADAITAHQAGYACLSPVTTTFKKADRDRLVGVLEDHDVPRVVVVQDAERPRADLADPDGGDGWDRLTVPQVGDGLAGALRTAAHLADHGLDARVAELPRPGLEKVDVDDYLREWADGDLGPVLAGAKPPREHPAYETVASDRDAVGGNGEATGFDGDAGDRSALFDLELTDVAPVDAGYRGENPLGHHGDSTDYFVVGESGAAAKDWKHGVGYNALTYLLCDADGPDDRRPSDPTGSLEATEVFTAWRHAKREGLLPDDDPVPYRALVGIARADGVVAADRLVYRCGADDCSARFDDRESARDHDCPESDGTPSVYRALPDADAYNAALEHVRDEHAVDPGREPVDARRDDGRPPTLRDVTLDPSVAHRAAGAVDPDDLAATGALEAVPTDAEGWRCPRCDEPVDVVRAAAIGLGLARTCQTPLDAGAYTRAYDYAREDLEAPLPEYVTAATATRNWDVVTGALRELTFHHLDADALASDVTATGSDVAGDAVLALDPAWRESESGASVVVYENGTIYEAHPDHEGALDPLRFVALDASADYADDTDDDPPLSWDDVVATDGDPPLTGDDFHAAYRLARQRYGAPLPEWDRPDADHTVALPPVDALVADRDDADARLEGAYDDVADEYDRAASTDDATLLRVLPGLGKTENVFRQADDHPVLYTAARKELMASAVDRAEQNGVSAYVLPVFSERGPPSAATEAGVAAVREHGQVLLRNPWRLVECVENRLAARDDPDAPDGLPTPESVDTDDDVDLERESCPTADGEHGKAWWLAVHVARGLGYSPRYIHTHAPALFGDDLPCQYDRDDADERVPANCPYSAAWDRATDPDAPVDVLVGSYVHAHVEGARTYYTRTENGRVEREPRVVAVDEFPGDAYADTFGDEFPDMATWLAGCLRDDVADRQALFQHADDLWRDDHVRAWLEGDTGPESTPEFAVAAAALGLARDVLDAVDTAEWLLEHRAVAVDDLGADDALRRLVDAAPEWDPDVVRRARADLAAALDAPGHRGGHPGVTPHLADLADHAALRADADRPLTDRLEDHLAAPHIAGDLADLGGRALAAYREGADRADVMLRNAATALRGGEHGVEELAAYADDGHAHPQAHALLYGVLAPDGEDGPATTLATDQFSFDPDPGTRLQRVPFGRRTVLVGREHRGALVMAPPAFTAAGEDNPVVGLDATGRRQLWRLAIGRDVTIRDIHDSDRERQAFLRDVYGLRVVQTSEYVNSYEGDPTGKNFDDDVAVVRTAGDAYGGAALESGARLDDAPAVVTTKVVEDTVDELHDAASQVAHYGDVKGSERLADHRLAALVGCQHYGDGFIERWAALAGESVTRTGHGTRLDYGSAVANTALRHMREDQVMQAALRFGRDTNGALVLAHTAALREDLPVVGTGEVLRTFTENAQDVAEAVAGMVGRRFTSGDVRDRLERAGVDVSARTVRRILEEFADAGYLERHEHGNGRAHEYRTLEAPPDAEVELPDKPDLAATAGAPPGQAPIGVSYTVAVRVPDGEPEGGAVRRRPGALLEPPDTASGAAPPG